MMYLLLSALMCKPGLVYSPCGPVCQKKCADIGQAEDDCCKTDYCVEGCYCPPGQYLYSKYGIKYININYYFGRQQILISVLILSHSHPEGVTLRNLKLPSKT